MLRVYAGFSGLFGGLGFGLQGLAYILEGIGFRVKGQGLAVEGLGLSSGEHSVPWHNGGKPFPALQQRRVNKKIGVVIETRAVLPHRVYKRVMVMQFRLLGEKGNPDVVCNRLLKPINN